jgi:ribosomal protein L22
MEKSLPAIPAKRYFTIGEVSELCGVKPHVLRYWEQEFTQLKPVKRRGNRRYYQHHEVLLIRRIRQLLYEEGFTISGARHRLDQAVEQATTTLQFTPKLGARIVQKVLKSAVANALHEGKVRLEDLYVKEAVVGAGPTLKRWLPRAQDRATPLLKRTSHVSVIVATKESL